MIKAMNESSNVALAKMEGEAKILMVDMSTMDLLARAWYMMYHDFIGKVVMAGVAADHQLISLCAAWFLVARLERAIGWLDVVPWISELTPFS
jgi:hypothetical protein